MTSRSDLEAALEAILFVTSEPVSRARLLATFDAGDQAEAEAALAAVAERYRAAEGRGVFLEEVAGGLRLVTSPEQHPYLRKFFETAGGNKLSMAALETLAIVAYRQPITGPEIQELRSKNSSTALKTLLERRMLRIAGRKEVVGRPFIYATTREFLMHFGLRNLDELPPLEEFEETFGGDIGAERGLGERAAVATRRADPGEEVDDATLAAAAGDPDPVPAAEDSNEVAS
ncbi:MAG: SMC-Scp complex subunit ScpB [Thermoanaerobaculia bacterium]